MSATRESAVTVLAADIRGFTELSARIGPRRMKDMLDHYFPALVKALHEHGGTVERFAGDAIFAVFGSPVPDDQQYEHALIAQGGHAANTVAQTATGLIYKSFQMQAAILAYTDIFAIGAIMAFCVAPVALFLTSRTGGRGAARS